MATLLTSPAPATSSSTSIVATLEAVAIVPIFSFPPTSKRPFVSFQVKVTLVAVPLSISIPEVTDVTPAPVSPLFKTITLSVIAVLVVSRLVKEPCTVKSPVTTKSSPMVTTAVVAS